MSEKETKSFGGKIIRRQSKFLDGSECFCDFSLCEKYRYILHKSWNTSRIDLHFIMLNPSTATEEKNDPTIARCEHRARMSGYGGLVVLNIFAFRATNPIDLKNVSDPVGELNNKYIETAILKAKHDYCDIICGWGNHGSYLERERDIIKMFQSNGLEPKALSWTKNGHPKHPLYIPYSAEPKGNDNG